MRPDPLTEGEVAEVLRQMVDAAGRRDAEAAIALFADDPDVFLYGTGVDEARKGPAAIRAQIERDVSQSDAWSWMLRQQSISSAAGVAWTAGDVVIRVVIGPPIEAAGRDARELNEEVRAWIEHQLAAIAPTDG